MRFFIFIPIATSIFMGSYFYMKHRLVRKIPWLGSREKYASGLLLFLIIFSLLSLMFRFYLKETSLTDNMIRMSFIGMGIYTICFSSTILLDISKGISFFARSLFSQNRKSTDKGRRDFFHKFSHAGIVILGGHELVGGYVSAYSLPEVVKIDIPVEGLSPDFRKFSIIQVSDLHISANIKKDYVEKVVELVLQQNGDVFALTGDLADGSVKHLARDAEPMAEISKKWPSYFVSGNHEYYSGVSEWQVFVQNLGYRVLNNEHEVISHLGRKIVLGGVRDYACNRVNPNHSSSPQLAMKNAPVDRDLSILLAHQPRSLYEAEQAGFDVQISGHTHGGQYFPWNYMVNLFQPYTRGLGRHKNTLIYVNSGTGFWGPPIRYGTKSEITILNIIPA